MGWFWGDREWRGKEWGWEWGWEPSWFFPSCGERRAEPHCWAGKTGEEAVSVCFGVFLPPTLSWEGGGGKELPKSGVEETHSPPEGKALNMQNTQARAGSEQEGGRCCDLLVQKDITAGAKREIKSGYKDTGRAACGKTCCFSNGTTENESHFTIIFCPGLVPAEF